MPLAPRGRDRRPSADELFISGHTVNNHLRSVFEKVGVRSRPELVQRLFVRDLLPDTPAASQSRRADKAPPRVL